MLTNLDAAIEGVFGPLWKDGVLHHTILNDNGKGGFTKDEIDAPCKYQIDRTTQRQRPEGYSETDVRVLILAGGLGDYFDGGRVGIDDTMTTDADDGGKVYRLAAPQLDPAGSHWDCRGRLKP